MRSRPVPCPARVRRIVGALLLALASCCPTLAAPSTAQAAVGFRSSSASSSSTSGASNSLGLALARPPGLAVDDVMIATVQWVLKTANGSAATATAPAGWTAIDDNNQTGWAVVAWWKRATAADVAASSFAFTGSWTNRQGIASGVLAAYSGVVSTGSPIAWGDVQRTGNSSATIGNGQYGFARPGDGTFGAPAYTPIPGSLGITFTMADRSGNANQLDLSSLTGGTLVASQPATGGGGTDSINTTVAYAAPDGFGSYATPYTQMTFANTIQWTAFSLVLQPTPCGAGGTSLSAPTVAFPSTALSTGDTQAAVASSITVDDESENGATSSGWNVTLSPTRFTAGSWQLPASALSIVSASDADGGGRCAAPSNGVAYAPLSLPAGSTTKVYNAAANTGRGSSAVTLNLRLAIPANTRAGTYSSTWTYTLNSGP